MSDNVPDFMQGFEDNDFDFGFTAVSQEEVDQSKQQSEVIQQVSKNSANIEPRLQTLESKLDQVLEVAKREFNSRLEEKETALSELNQEKFKALEQLILPLLYKLGKSEESYIYWPNRKQIITKQINKILEITRP